MSFIAYVIQEGEGCGYSIGCGRVLWWLKSETREEALNELKTIIIGEWYSEDEGYGEGYWDDSKLEEVTLFEISSEEKTPLFKWYEEANKYAYQQRNKKKEKNERATLKRLKKKYGSKT